MHVPGEPESEIVEHTITRLQPHPRQADLFGDPSPEEIRELAADIERNGLNVPLEVLPDGTLMCGHKRLAAVSLLGWATVPVRVRHDLAANPAAAERRLIEDNLTRRQLGPLEVARCARRLKELARRNPAAPLAEFEARELREQIGKRLGLSGRHVDRLIRIIDRTPSEIQHAVARGAITIMQAHAVAGLTPAQKQAVASRIRAGENPRQVVAACPIPRAKPRPVVALGLAVARLARQLRRAVDTIGPRAADLRGLTPETRKTLDEAVQLIHTLKKAAGGRRGR